MAKAKVSTSLRPLNVFASNRPDSKLTFYTRAGLPGGEAAHPEAIAPGIKPTPKHNLVFHHGKTIQHLTYTNLYIGGPQAWKVSDMQSIDHALAAAMSDKNLNNVMVQYFKNQPITSVFKPSQVLPGTKPSVFSQGDVEHLVTQLQRQGKLNGYDLTSTVFNFMLPSGTVLNTDEGVTGNSGEHAAKPANAAAKHKPTRPEEGDTSLEGLGGYHGSVHVSNQVTVYYAVGAYSETLPNGTQNGIVAFDHPWKNVVATFYHELNEARTDADVEDAIRAGNDPKAVKFLGWVSRQGEECGDYPMAEVGASLGKIMKEVPLTDGSGTVPIQFQYSNAVSGPEGPIPTPHPLH